MRSEEPGTIAVCRDRSGWLVEIEWNGRCGEIRRREFLPSLEIGDDRHESEAQISKVFTTQGYGCVHVRPK